MLEQLRGDIRYAAHMLVAGRLFTAVAVVCLALGIATNTTMFSVFDAMFLRPLPFEAPDRLVSIAGRNPTTGRRVTLSDADYREWAPTLRSFAGIAAYSGRAVALTDGGEPERVAAQLVSANLFPTLGVHAQIGRPLEAADDRAGAANVALIGDALWRRRYQSDPSVLGRLIRLDEVPYTVIGVMPAGFKFPAASDLCGGADVLRSGASRRPSACTA